MFIYLKTIIRFMFSKSLMVPQQLKCFQSCDLLLVYGGTAAESLPRDESSSCVSVTVFAVC